MALFSVEVQIGFDWSASAGDKWHPATMCRKYLVAADERGEAATLANDEIKSIALKTMSNILHEGEFVKAAVENLVITLMSVSDVAFKGIIREYKSADDDTLR